MKQKTLSEKVWKSPLSERDLFTKEDVKQFIKEILDEIEFAQQDPFDGFDGQIFELISNIIKQKAGDDLI